MRRLCIYVVLVGLSACTFSHQKGLGIQGSLGGVEAQCEPIDFARLQSEIFGLPGGGASDGKCIACHGSGSSLMVLDSYASIKSRVSQIADAVQNNRMPKNSPLSSELKALLATWVKQGSPEFSVDANVAATCVDGGGVVLPQPLPLEPNYESLKANIFSTKCLGCHSADPTAVSSYDFSTFESIVSYKKLFKIPTPGEDSRFVKALVSGDMPEGGTPLTATEIAVVRDWVATGLPETSTSSTLPEIPTVPPTLPTEIPPDTTTPTLDLSCIDYKFISTQVFEQKCTACHGVKGGVNLESYSNVKLHLSKIEDMVATDQMPPKKPLDADLKKYVLAWIKNGAPENLPSGGTCQAPVTPVVKPLVPTYNSIREHFLEVKCLSCHSGTSFAKKGQNDYGGDNEAPDFSTYQAMISHKKLFNFKKPHKSELMEVIYDGEMPPVQSGIKALTPLETTTLLEWIKNGLPEG